MTLNQGFLIGAVLNIYLTDKIGFGKVVQGCIYTRTHTDLVGLFVGYITRYSGLILSISDIRLNVSHRSCTSNHCICGIDTGSPLPSPCYHVCYQRNRDCHAGMDTEDFIHVEYTLRILLGFSSKCVRSEC